MRSVALTRAIEDDPALGTSLNQLAEVLARNNGKSFEEALDILHVVLSDYLIYVIEEEP